MHSLWKVYFVFIFSFTVLFSLFTKVNAQTNKILSGDSTVYQNMEIEFKTGLIIYGNIVYQNDSILILYSNEYKGTVTIEKSKIVPLKYPYDKDFIKELKEKKHFLDYSTGAFGINLRKGLGYYQNAMLVLNSFNVGVTKNIVIGGGFELSSFFRRSPVFS